MLNPLWRWSLTSTDGDPSQGQRKTSGLGHALPSPSREQAASAPSAGEVQALAKDQLCIARRREGWGGCEKAAVCVRGGSQAPGEWATPRQQGRSGDVLGEEPATLGHLVSRPQGQQAGRW